MVNEWVKGYALELRRIRCPFFHFKVEERIFLTFIINDERLGDMQRVIALVYAGGGSSSVLAMEGLPWNTPRFPVGDRASLIS